MRDQEKRKACNELCVILRTFKLEKGRSKRYI